MFKPLLLCALFIFFLAPAHGQRSRTEDVLHLSNHWTLRGSVIVRTDSMVQIRTRDGNIFSFPSSQVERITRESAWSVQSSIPRGWTSYTELGPLIAGKTSENGVTTAAFSFQTLIGYTFRSPVLVPFAGVGADLYATRTVLPLFGSVRADLVRHSGYSLYCFADAGHGIDITQRPDANTSYKGGVLYAAGLGVRIPFSGNAGFLLSLGYRYQKTRTIIDGQSQEEIYRRLALRAGFYL